MNEYDSYIVSYSIDVPTVRKYRDKANEEFRLEAVHEKYSFDLFKNNWFSRQETFKDNVEHRKKMFAHVKQASNQFEIAASQLRGYEEHLGNLLYIAEPSTTVGLLEEDFSLQSENINNIIREENLELYKMLRIIESDSFDNYEIVVRHKYNSKDESNYDFPSYCSSILIPAIYEALRADMYNRGNGLVYRNAEFLTKDYKLTTQELLDLLERFPKAPEKYSAESRYRDYKLRLILDYLNNETDVNPRNSKMPKKAAIIIYWLLRLFYLVPEPSKEAHKYIISLNNNITNKYGDQTSKEENI